MIRAVEKPTSGKSAFRHPDWPSRLLAGERATLARAITLVENESPAAREVLRVIHDKTGRARVIGFTGAPGGGKSTLVNAFVAELRRRAHTVGVVAVDPSSPLTGGAVLGDRVRMAEHAMDEGVYLRSLAARGHLGGLTQMTGRVVDLMDAAGLEWIVVETVGAGQSEVEIAGLAHCKVVVCAPGLGDQIQAVKAGILEIADLLVVNKSDHPLADQTVQHLREALRLGREEKKTPVLKTVAIRAEGMVELVDAVEAHLAGITQEQRRELNTLRLRRLVAQTAARQVERAMVQDDSGEMADLVERMARGEIDAAEAAELSLKRLIPPE